MSFARRALALAAALGLLAMHHETSGHGSEDHGHSEAQAVPRMPSAPGARVYFIGLENGAQVGGTLTVRFGLSGMGVAPAGYPGEGTGHHHLIVDAELPPLDASLPNDATHRHFGGGQTETEIELAPGDHTLQLVFADHNHVPHDPPLVSERITVRVE